MQTDAAEKSQNHTRHDAGIIAVDVVDDLVNCIGKETSVNDKLNLEPVMPNLIQRLKFGMNVIPVTPVIREKFIAGLKQYHQDLIEKARVARPSEKQPSCEDITVPSFRTSSSKTPFMDELLVDNKKGYKKDFDLE